MKSAAPQVVVLAGPNGAGKSTAAPRLLKGALRVDEFVNADTIASGLSAFSPERVAFQAGRVMLTRLRELAAQRATFAFETTLASRSFAPWIGQLVQSGHRFGLVFLWLPTPDMAISRVAHRVELGGHDAPSETICRRYSRGLHNFFSSYRPLATQWRVYDNSENRGPRLVASGGGMGRTIVRNTRTWRLIEESAANDGREFPNR